MGDKPSWLHDYGLVVPPIWRHLESVHGEAIRGDGLTYSKLRKQFGLSEYRATVLLVYARQERGTQPTVDVAAANGATPYTVAQETQPQVDSPAHYLQEQRYIYEEDRDVYVTFLKCVKKPLVMPGEKHRAIAQAYSNWDGAPATLNEIARSFEIPRPWLVEYLRAHQITHDREPFSAEEVAGRDVDEMVGDALQARRGQLYQRYETEKWAAIKKDARRWMEFEETVLHAMTAALSDAPAYSVPKIRLSRSVSPFALVVGLTDFHWGAYSWAKETGQAYDRHIAEERLIKSTEQIMARLPGQPDKIILPVGSDFFHVDGYNATTTRGTPQDVDATPTEILITGCELTRSYVDLLRQVAPVEIVMMAGNHDRVNGIAVLLYLTAWYRDVDDVTVVQDYKPRVYREFGNVLIGFSHGDTVKPKDLGTVIATEAREAWGRCEHHVAFGGHLHHQEVLEAGGITHYMMPSLSGGDRWHANNGYTNARAGLCAYLVDEQDGVIATMFAPVKKQ